jgi:hypothetical protein
MDSLGFLDDFLTSRNMVKSRYVSDQDIGQDLDREAADVPLYNQYNNGLAIGQEGRERVNLSIDPEQMVPDRCGITGVIPSAEVGLMTGAQPQPRQLMVDLPMLEPANLHSDMMSQRVLQAGINR